MSIKSFDSCEEFAVISQTDKDLIVVQDRGVEDTQGSIVEFKDFEFGEFGFR